MSATYGRPGTSEAAASDGSRLVGEVEGASTIPTAPAGRSVSYQCNVERRIGNYFHAPDMLEALKKNAQHIVAIIEKEIKVARELEGLPIAETEKGPHDDRVRPRLASRRPARQRAAHTDA